MRSCPRRTGHSHVLHVDTDTIALNASRSLAPFLSHPAAVQLQLRETGEVAAATYVVRRSHEAACFLSLWDEIGHATHRAPMPMGNTDNGVLVMLLSADRRSGTVCVNTIM